MYQSSLPLFDVVGALVVVFERDGRIVHWNRACSALTGYSLEEIKGRHAWELIADDEVASVKTTIAQLDLLDDATFGCHVITRSGARRWIHWSSMVSCGAIGAQERVIATGIDRTEEKDAEDRLRVSEARLRGILAAADDAIICVDGNQDIQVYSAGAERIFGWSLEDVLGKRIDRLFPRRYRLEHWKLIESYLDSDEDRNAHCRREIPAMRKDGDEFPAEVAISRSGGQSDPMLTVVVRDISRRKHLEDSLREQLQSRDELARTIVHDLRNPLHLIAMQAQMLLETRRHPERRSMRSIERIRRSARRMSDLLDDLLDVACIEAGRLVVQPNPIALVTVVDDVVDAARASAGHAGVEIICHDLDSLPLVKGDEARLQQVLDNLVGNALKFTRKDGCIQILGEARGNEVILEVRDTGVGMTADQLEHLFDPFWQASPGDRRGAGLGLSIAHGIIAAHKGRMWARSDPGAGTSVFFSLPRASAKQAVEVAGDRDLGATQNQIRD